MKTRELIAKLQELDPAGDLDVVVGNEPVYFPERLPAFYDGAKGELVQDPDLIGFNIKGYKITNQGEKIVLHLYGLEAWLMDEPHGQVDTSELPDWQQERYAKMIEQFRKESIEVEMLSEADKKVTLNPGEF
jgi:hypothetical protein